MLKNEKIIAFLATADPRTTRTFYEGQLGLKLGSEDDFAIVYQIQGTELRIQKLGSFSPQPHTALGWSVTTIEKTVRALTSAGVAFDRHDGLHQDELGVWKAPSGAKVAWFKDPAGNTLSLTQHADGRS